MNIIEINNLHFAYPHQVHDVIDNVSAVFKEGKIYRIAGRNGSGKSTFLKLIAKLVLPKSGTVEQSGGTVYLNQDANSFTAEHLTVREQLFVGCGMSESNLVRYIKSYGIGLEERLNDFVSELSGGQRQIIALLSVILSEAKVVCLDEFMSAMDPLSVKNTLRILNNENQCRKLTIIYVSHTDGLFENEEVCEMK